MTAHKYGGDLLIGRPSSFDRELDRKKSQKGKHPQKIYDLIPTSLLLQKKYTNATQTRLFWRELKVQTQI